TRSPDPAKPYVAVTIRGNDATSYMLINTRTQQVTVLPGNIRGYEPQVPATIDLGQNIQQQFISALFDINSADDVVYTRDPPRADHGARPLRRALPRRGRAPRPHAGRWRHYRGPPRPLRPPRRFRRGLRHLRLQLCRRYVHRPLRLPRADYDRSVEPLRDGE